jgi:ferredoxin
VKVRFTRALGEAVATEATPGDNLLRLAQAAGMPLEGTCEGQMACSTCHVIIDAEWFGRLPPASEEEEDMLDLALHVTRCSRLSCQIWLSEQLESLTVKMPGGAHNMQGR